MRNKTTKKTSRAPMRAESYKRFSLYKKIKKRSWLDFLFDWIVKGIIIALLISINFVLFASSANYSMFAEGIYVIPNIVLPIVVIFTISLTFMFFISFSQILENLSVSLVAGLFVYATINQFMILSPDSFLYSIFYTKISPQFAKNFITNSDIVAAITTVIATFLLLTFLRNKIILIGAAVLAIIFAAIIADEYINQRNKQEFVTLYENQYQAGNVKGNKFIYIMLPNATSYRYLSDMEEEKIATNEISKTKELMLGFYAKNNFTMYANSYVEDDNQFMNIVNQFNILSNKKGEDSILDKVMIDGYMKFKNHNEKSVYLEDNMLFDKFKNANYRINVYQSHGIELCQSNNEVIADKCVEKQSRPFNFDNMNISELQKTKLLLLQWINSTTLIKDLSSWYSFVNVFTDANKVALVGVSYDNLYVINSIKTLDIMFNDILSENCNTTYFALLDIPSEMYVYDEFCNIKQSSEWLSKENLPWVKVPNLENRKKAYMQQVDCLYGKMQEFMNKLRAYGLDENSVVVIQGISGLSDKKNSPNFIEEFRSKKAVTMAIREPKKRTFEVDYNACPVSSVLIKYLYGKNICKGVDDFDVSQSTKVELYKDMMAKPITNEDTAKAIDNFSEWYRKWERNNSKTVAGVNIIRDMVEIDSSEIPLSTITEIDVDMDEPEDVIEEIKIPEPKEESFEDVVVATEEEVVNDENMEQSSAPVDELITSEEIIKETTYEVEDENFFDDEAPIMEETTSVEINKHIDIIVDDDELLSIDIDEILSSQ